MYKLTFEKNVAEINFYDAHVWIYKAYKAGDIPIRIYNNASGK